MTQFLSYIICVFCLNLLQETAFHAASDSCHVGPTSAFFVADLSSSPFQEFYIDPRLCFTSFGLYCMYVIKLTISCYCSITCNINESAVIYLILLATLSFPLLIQFNSSTNIVLAYCIPQLVQYVFCANLTSKRVGPSVFFYVLKPISYLARDQLRTLDLQPK